MSLDVNWDFEQAAKTTAEVAVEPPEDSGLRIRKLRMKQDEGGDKRGRESAAEGA